MPALFRPLWSHTGSQRRYERSRRSTDRRAHEGHRQSLARRGEPPGVASSRAGREPQSLGSGCSWPVAQSGRRRPSRSVPTRTGPARRLIRWPPADGEQTRGVPVADRRPGGAAQDTPQHSVDAGDATGEVLRDPCRCIQVRRPADVRISITTPDDPWQSRTGPVVEGRNSDGN